MGGGLGGNHGLEGVGMGVREHEEENGVRTYTIANANEVVNIDQAALLI